MTRRTLSGLLLGLLLMVGLSLASTHHSATAQSDPASEIFQLVNQVRMAQGLPPFQYNGALAAAAQAHANWMATNVIYSHTGAGGSTPASRAANAGYVGYVSENIVGGTSMSPRQGILWWQNSAVHYNTIVSARYVEAGTAFATNGDQNMYVLVVGRQSNNPEVLARSPEADNSAEPLIITPITLAEPREDGSIVHVIQPGQALWTVAAYYDVDLDYLYLINNFTADHVLHPGDEVMVRLPEGQSPPPTPTPPLTHTVLEGENAWSISAKHNITVDYLYLLNGLSPDAMLHPGDQLVVRLAEGQAPPPTPTPRVTHIVRSGDSAWSIAASYGLTVEQLLAFNNLSVDAVLLPGSELLIREPTPTPQPTSTPPSPTATAQPLTAGSANPSPSPVAISANLSQTLVDPARADEALKNPDSQDSGGGGIVSAVLIIFALLAVSGAVMLVAKRH